jgi:hypothetical protein
MESRKTPLTISENCNKGTRVIAPGFQAIHIEYEFDSNFLDVLYDVHSISQDMATVNPPRSEVIPMRLRQRIRSIQYSLLSRQHHDDISKSADHVVEVCRLGVLLYLGIIQNDFWFSSISQQMRITLKSCFGSLESQSFATDSTHALHLWLVFMAGALVSDLKERAWIGCWINLMASQLSLSSWSDTKAFLESFAWTGKVQDKSGRGLWDEAIVTQNALQD